LKSTRVITSEPGIEAATPAGKDWMSAGGGCGWQGGACVGAIVVGGSVAAGGCVAAGGSVAPGGSVANCVSTEVAIRPVSGVSVGETSPDGPQAKAISNIVAIMKSTRRLLITFPPLEANPIPNDPVAQRWPKIDARWLQPVNIFWWRCLSIRTE
jgi:hypothetical protein